MNVEPTDLFGPKDRIAKIQSDQRLEIGNSKVEPRFNHIAKTSSKKNAMP